MWMTWLRLLVSLAKEAIRVFRVRQARLLTGSIAFYSLVSVVPMLVIALRLAGLLVDEREAGSTLAHELARWVGATGARTLLSLVNAVERQSASTLTGVLGTAALIYGSTRLFSQLTAALDLLWETPPEPDAKTWQDRVMRQARKRGLAFAMVLLVGLVLLALVLLQAALAATRHWTGAGVSLALRLVELGSSVALTDLLFTAILWLLPRAKVKLRDAAVGGAVTAVLFTAGSQLVTAYVMQRDVSVYGAASALVMLLLWTHYSAHVFFLGAAFTVAHARRAEALAP